MLHVGITGGMGSGKSTVCSVFAQLGIPVYNSDAQAKWLIANRLEKEISQSFGQDIFENNVLNKSLLASRAFNSKENTQRLNDIVHPAVGQDYLEWRSTCKAYYTLKEAALLIEAGSYKTLDKLIVVVAPVETRIERILQRDSISIDEIEARISKQLSDEERLHYADYVIDNSGTQSLIKQVISIHENLKGLSNNA